MIVRHPDVPDDEIALLAQAAEWPQYTSLDEVTEETLRKVTDKNGIDFATALLFDRIVRSGEHSDFIRRMDELRHDGIGNATAIETTVAVVPGAFYVEHPHTGAGGEVIRKEAARLGCRVELIPTRSVGTPRENGDCIYRWLAERTEERIVLVSLSKGGTDVKMALAQPSADQVFEKVKAWLNVGGIVSGSPMVAWVLSSKLLTFVGRLLFWWKGRDFRFVTTLDRRQGGDLECEPKIPDHLSAIHVFGFPMRKHLSSPRSRRWHRRLESYGPNDGVTLLADALRLPGHILPVWGTDHYLQDGWDADGLITALLHCVAQEQGLYASTRPDQRETA